mgnify:CR=1 FL=1
MLQLTFVRREIATLMYVPSPRISALIAMLCHSKQQPILFYHWHLIFLKEIQHLNSFTTTPGLSFLLRRVFGKFRFVLHISLPPYSRGAAVQLQGRRVQVVWVLPKVDAARAQLAAGADAVLLHDLRQRQFAAREGAAEVAHVVQDRLGGADGATRAAVDAQFRVDDVELVAQPGDRLDGALLHTGRATDARLDDLVGQRCAFPNLVPRRTLASARDRGQ